MKKKIYIPIIVSLCLAIFILNRTGAIDFGLQHLIARFMADCDSMAWV